MILLLHVTSGGSTEPAHSQTAHLNVWSLSEDAWKAGRSWYTGMAGFVSHVLYSQTVPPHVTSLRGLSGREAVYCILCGGSGLLKSQKWRRACVAQSVKAGHDLTGS